MRNFMVMLLLLAQIFSYGQNSQISVVSAEEAVNMAIKNNPAVANAALKIAQSQLMKSTAWDFQPAELKYRSGQIYRPEHDRYIEINQGFGSLLEHINNYRLANKYLQLSKTEFAITHKNITAEVKSAYYFWVYTYNKLMLHEQKNEIFSDIERIAELQYKKGDIGLLEMTALCTEAARVQTELNMLHDELEMAQNEVKQLIVTDMEILPSIRELPMYKINKASDTSHYRNNILSDYYKSLFEIDSFAVKFKTAAFFPEISFGIINQHIAPYSGLWAWQLEFSFPVLFFNKIAEVRKAKLEAQISENEYEYQLFAINMTIDNLILDLNMTFKKLIHFDQYALLQAEQIMQTAELQLEKEEIGYIEYARQTSESIAVKLEYLDILNRYNQIAIQLEFYAN